MFSCADLDHVDHKSEIVFILLGKKSIFEDYLSLSFQ
jgi:hypothetical protein